MEFNEVLNPTEFVKYMGDKEILEDLKQNIKKAVSTFVSSEPEIVSTFGNPGETNVKLFIKYEDNSWEDFDKIKSALNKLLLNQVEYQNLVMDMFKNNELAISTDGIDKKDLEDRTKTAVLLDDPREVNTKDDSGNKVYTLSLNLTLKNPNYKEPVQETTTASLTPEN